MARRLPTSAAPACGARPWFPCIAWLGPRFGPANASSSTLLSAAAFGVVLSDSTAGISVPAIVPRNTASTSPRTARNAALGLSSSRRVASSGEAPFRIRAHHRAVVAVSHGPATISPIMTMSRPG